MTVQNSAQTALLCGCGSSHLLRRGLCAYCLRRARLSEEKFAGLRELVLERDGRRCRCCDEVDAARLVVHHRRPGWNRERWLITICRACHVRVHLMFRPRYSTSPLLYALWREMHPRAPVQARLPLELTAPAAEQADLFPTEIGGQIDVALELDHAVSKPGRFFATGV